MPYIEREITHYSLVHLELEVDQGFRPDLPERDGHNRPTNKIQRWIDMGWQPFGPPIHAAPNFRAIYQPMVKWSDTMMMLSNTGE